MQIEEIPFGYASCYATDKECAKAVHCLRRQVARLYQLQPEPPTTNYCVTPAYVAQVAKGEACREFRSDAPCDTPEACADCSTISPKRSTTACATM